MPAKFDQGGAYTRQQVAALIAMPAERQGGNWMTGYARIDDASLLALIAARWHKTG
jgi:hypothetical protein